MNTNQRKKIVLVSGIQVFPPESGGQLRSANLCLALVKSGYDVEIFSFTGRKKDYLSLKKSSEEKINSHLSEYVDRNPLSGILQFLFYQLKLPPLWLVWLTRFYFPKVLKNKLSDSQCCILDFPFLYPVYKHTSIPVIINTHNAEFELYPKDSFTSRVVKKIEIEAFKIADTVLFCNEADKDKFKDFVPALEAKAKHLPNGIDIEKFVFDKNEREKLREQLKLTPDMTVFLFTGSRFLPNQRAFEFLVKWAHDSSAQLTAEKIVIVVAGTVSETLVDHPYLKVVGKVPEMIPYLWLADFGLNAIEEGSGTNVKMMEFLAARLPILTTSFGARGLQLVDQHTCFFFERSNLFEVMKKAKAMNEQQKQSMSEAAFEKNQQVIDMGHALKNLDIKW